MSSQKCLKTTSTHFNLFKKYFNEHALELGLLEWKYYFKHKHLENLFASTCFNLESKIVSVTFTTDWCCNDCDYKLTTENIRSIARHEVHHVLLGQLYELARYRFITKDRLDEAEERVVRILDKVL